MLAAHRAVLDRARLAMADFVWKGASYLAEITAEIPLYARLQEELAAATADVRPARILDLGTGTGETARRVLALHPDAELVGVDDSPDMLEHARRCCRRSACGCRSGASRRRCRRAPSSS